MNNDHRPQHLFLRRLHQEWAQENALEVDHHQAGQNQAGQGYMNPNLGQWMGNPGWTGDTLFLKGWILVQDFFDALARNGDDPDDWGGWKETPKNVGDGCPLFDEDDEDWKWLEEECASSRNSASFRGGPPLEEAHVQYRYLLMYTAPRNSGAF